MESFSMYKIERSHLPICHAWLFPSAYSRCSKIHRRCSKHDSRPSGLLLSHADAMPQPFEFCSQFAFLPCFFGTYLQALPWCFFKLLQNRGTGSQWEEDPDHEWHGTEEKKSTVGLHGSRWPPFCRFQDAQSSIRSYLICWRPAWSRKISESSAMFFHSIWTEPAMSTHLCVWMWCSLLIESALRVLDPRLAFMDPWKGDETCEMKTQGSHQSP